MPDHAPDRHLAGRRVFVSRRSHEHNIRPRFVYRETPDDARDSGWRAVIGDESRAEVDNPHSIVLLTVGDLWERWPELRPVFETALPDGTWRWDDELGRYEQLRPDERSDD